MSNAGKFIDRCPIICAAGKPSAPNTNVAETFREYNLVQEIKDLEHNAKISDEDVPVGYNKLSKVENVRHRGTDDFIRQHLSGPVKTRYQQLVTDLKETTYGSYWKKPLGKPADGIPALPAGTDSVETIFGHPPKRSTPVYEVILPKIPTYQVLWDSQINHDNYKKIYHDYNIGEKIDRNYFKPPYNPNDCAGSKNRYDERGRGTACAMKWFNEEPVTVASKRQADYSNVYQIKLGEVYAPAGSSSQLPESHTFGVRLGREAHGVQELLKPGCEPSIYKRDTLSRMSSLNLLRQSIKKRFSPTFTLISLSDSLAYYDQEGTDFIKLKDLYDVLAFYHISLHKENIQALFQDLHIIQGDKINYRKFVDALNFNMELEKQLDPLPKDKLHYVSQSTSANLDRSDINNYYSLNCAPAGLPSHRNDLKIPPKKNCEYERENLPTDNVKALLERSLFLQYNISYRDMFKSRSKDFIRTLFENCGYHFADGSFDSLFKMAMDEDENGCGGVSVDSFYKILKKNLPPMKRIVDEMDFCSKPLHIPCFCG